MADFSSLEDKIKMATMNTQRQMAKLSTAPPSSGSGVGAPGQGLPSASSQAPIAASTSKLAAFQATVPAASTAPATAEGDASNKNKKKKSKSKKSSHAAAAVEAPHAPEPASSSTASNVKQLVDHYERMSPTPEEAAAAAAAESSASTLVEALASPPPPLLAAVMDEAADGTNFLSAPGSPEIRGSCEIDVNSEAPTPSRDWPGVVSEDFSDDDGDGDHKMRYGGDDDDDDSVRGSMRPHPSAAAAAAPTSAPAPAASNGNNIAPGGAAVTMSVPQRTEALFREAERRHVNMAEQRKAEATKHPFAPRLVAKRRPTMEDVGGYDHGDGSSSGGGQRAVHDRLYSDASKQRARKEQTSKSKATKPDPNCTFTPQVSLSASSLRSAASSTSEEQTSSSSGATRPRFEVLYEDSLVRQERRRRAEEEARAKKQAAAGAAGGGEGGGFGNESSFSPYGGRSLLDDSRDLDPSPGSMLPGHDRKFDPDRTEALYQDAHRRRESQSRIRAAEEASLMKTFSPDISASMQAVQPLKDATDASSTASTLNADGSSSNGSSLELRFDRLYADAKQRQDAKSQALKEKEKEFTFQPVISESQKARAGGVGGSQRFDALFEEATQRAMKKRSKQQGEALQFEQEHFKPAQVTEHTAALVDQAVRAGKREPDTIARLYKCASEAKAKEEAQLKRQAELEQANCTFKPTISASTWVTKPPTDSSPGGGGGDKQQEEALTEAAASKARREKLYEDSASKLERKARLAKQLLEEESKEFTFKPTVNANGGGSGKKKAKANKANKTPSPSSKGGNKLGGGGDDGPSLPAHERLHKTAASLQQKRSKDHERRFLSEECTFAPNLSRRQSKGSADSGGRRSKQASSADSVVATAGKVGAKQRAGSPFAHHPNHHFSSSNDDVASSGSSGGSRFEMLYQHGVQRGLVRLSAQHDRDVDVDAREMTECTFKPATSRDHLLKPLATSSTATMATNTAATSFAASKHTEQAAAAAAAAAAASDDDDDDDNDDDGDGGQEGAGGREEDRQHLHSRVADLLAKRKARQQAADNEFLQAAPAAAAKATVSFAADAPPPAASSVAAAMGFELEAFAAENAPQTAASSGAVMISESEARKVFDSYDVNGDGVLDPEEFAIYLTSVFYSLAHTEAFQAHGVSPFEMATATAEQCFSEADEDGNGVLSFDEFKGWYSANPSSMGVSLADAGGLISESEAQKLFDAHDVNGDGVLDLAEFTSYLTTVFEALSHTQDFQLHGVSPLEMASATACECFEEADANRDGTLSFKEFQVWFRNHPSDLLSVSAVVANNGSSVIPEDDAREAFHAYDANGDGVLDLAEFTTYLTSVFEALAHTEEFQAHGATPFEIATATAEQCFSEADEDGNGVLSFDEFKSWFQGSGSSGQGETKQGAVPALASLEQARAHLEEAALSVDPDGFDGSSDWWLHFMPIVCVSASVAGALPPSLTSHAEAALGAVRKSLGHEDSSPWAPPPSDPLTRAALHREEALARLFLGAPHEALCAMDACLGLDPNGTSSKGGKGFVWGLKGRVLGECSGKVQSARSNGSGGKQWFQPEAAAQTSLVCLLRANQLMTKAKASSTVVSDSLEDALAANGMTSADFEEEDCGALSETSSVNDHIEQQQQQQQPYFVPLSPPAPTTIPEDQARDLFFRYDANGDGVLDLQEFTAYLTSVFEALAHTESFQAHGATPFEIATATAEQCFSEADEDGNGVLSFDEFKGWYQGTPMVSQRVGRCGEDPEFPPVASPLFSSWSPKQPYSAPSSKAARVSSSPYQRDPPPPSASAAAAVPPNKPATPFGVEEAVAAALGTAQRQQAEAVAEARLRMREILKDEVACLTLQHAKEQELAARQLEEQEALFFQAHENAVREAAAAQAQAATEFEQETLRLSQELEAQKRASVEQLRKAREHSCQALLQASVEAREAKARGVKEAQAELLKEVRSLQQQVAKSASRCEAVQSAHAGLHDELVELKGNIRVVCRVRPQVKSGLCVATRNSPTEVTLASKTTAATYSFDQVYGPSATQDHVFQSVKPLVRSALDGRDVCILAYGQTGSGKTHTLVGELPCPTETGGVVVDPLPEEAGVMPRTIAELFVQAATPQNNAARGFAAAAPSSTSSTQAAATEVVVKGVRTQTVFLTVLEVYNECVRDLLVDPHPSKGPPKVDLRVTKAGGVAVPNAMELEVPDAATTLEILSIANENRATAAHDLNAHSSRSHLVVTLRIETATTGEVGGAATTTSKLQLVDLAGCERTKASNVSGAQLAEAQAINKSLSALGDVVGALAGKSTAAQSAGLNHGGLSNHPKSPPRKKAATGSVTSHAAAGGGHSGGGGSMEKFIPYRNSKLTLLLQDALKPNGKSKVVMFVTASPELTNWNESVAALTFAARCRAVDLYTSFSASSAKKQAASSPDTEAELAAANNKIAELTQALQMSKGK